VESLARPLLKLCVSSAAFLFCIDPSRSIFSSLDHSYTWIAPHSFRPSATPTPPSPSSACTARVLSLFAAVVSASGLYPQISLASAPRSHGAFRRLNISPVHTHAPFLL
jgi:hypothetical protein